MPFQLAFGLEAVRTGAPEIVRAGSSTTTPRTQRRKGSEHDDPGIGSIVQKSICGSSSRLEREIFRHRQSRTHVSDIHGGDA